MQMERENNTYKEIEENLGKEIIIEDPAEANICISCE